MKRIAIVILNWNGRRFLEKFLPDVLKHSLEFARVIVADNASTDDSTGLLRKEFPGVEIIQLDNNYGFTGGYNRALEQVDAEFYLLLNSDVEVTQGWLKPLLEFMDLHLDAAGCQPKIRSFHDRQLLEHAGASGGFLDFLGYPFCRGRLFTTLEEDRHQYDESAPVFWATGACLLIRSKAFQQAGGFDERFFAHMEEIDLCWRLQLMGKSIWVVPRSVVYHVGGGTLPKNNPRKTFFNFRNNLLMLWKNLPLQTILWLLPLRLILDGIAGLKFLAEGHHQDFLAVIRAHFAFYRLAFFSRERGKPEKHSIPLSGLKGIYRRSIVWEYYIRKNTTFQQLKASLFT